MGQRHYRSSDLLTNRQFSAADRFAKYLTIEGYTPSAHSTVSADHLRAELPEMLLFSSRVRIFIDAIGFWSFKGVRPDDSLSEFITAQLAFSFRPYAIDILGSVLRAPFLPAAVPAAEHLGDLLVLLPPCELREHVRDQFVRSSSRLAEKEYNMARRNALFTREEWTNTSCDFILREPIVADPVMAMRGLMNGMI